MNNNSGGPSTTLRSDGGVVIAASEAGEQMGASLPPHRQPDPEANIGDGGKMPKRNEKLAAAGEEILALKLEIMALQNEVRQARRLERMKIAREILADEGEE